MPTTTAAGAQLSKSKIQAWSTAHLSEAASAWRTAATASENLFDEHRANVASPGGSTWQGDAKDAALDRVTTDTVVVSRQSSVLREAADLAESGRHDINAAQAKAVEAITAAESDGFRVGEDLSVTDTKRVDVFSMRARQTSANEHAEDIRWTAEQLAQTDKLVGHRLQTKAAELEGIRFEGEGPDTVVQAASFKQSPGPPVDPRLMSQAEALTAWEKLRADIAAHDSRCSAAIVGPLPVPQYNACQAEKAALDAQRAALQARLADFGIYPDGAPPGNGTGTGTGGDLTSIATQIGNEVAAIPRGAGVSQTQTLAERVTALHLSQADAARVADMASKRAFGATAGIATLPDGTKIVLPEQLMQRIAMQVHPDGAVTVFRGDLIQFLPYLG